MLYQELPRIESTALDRLGRLLAPALAIAIALTIGIVLLLMGQHVLAAVAVVAGGAGAAIIARKPAGEAPPLQSLNSAPDYSLVGSSLGLIREPVTLTTSDGSMLVVNEAYRERFGVALTVAQGTGIGNGRRSGPNGVTQLRSTSTATDLWSRLMDTTTR